MCNLTALAEEIKNIVSLTEGTACGKLIAVLEAAGITDTATLAQLINISERWVRKARIADARNPSSGTLVPQKRNPSSAAEPQFRENGTPVPRKPRAHASNTSRATKELREGCILEIPPTSGSPQAASLRSPNGSRLDKNWTLPDDWKSWTRTTFPTTTEAAVVAEAEKFADYWHAKAGQVARKIDWQATWRNWCRSAFTANGRRNGQPMNWGLSAHQQQRAKRLAELASLGYDVGESVQ